MQTLTEEQLLEIAACFDDADYFIQHYCFIYDAEALDWIPFELWPEQVEVLRIVLYNQLVIILKARQLGLTWLMLAIALWLMIFHPIASVMLFSRRENEAWYLLGEERLSGMFKRLPDWMKPDIEAHNSELLRLSNGSTARAFPSNAGDSYTATFALIDEADLVPDLKTLINKTKPAIDAGGQLVLLSRSKKDDPQSVFKTIYRAAAKKLNKYVSVFLPWWVRPGRTQEWYEEEKTSSFKTFGSLDDLYEQYPATPEEALAPATLGKRIPPDWLNRVYKPMEPLRFRPTGAPDIPELRIFRLPEPGRRYVLGMDCAEGLPDSDDSVTIVLDALTLEEVANFGGKITPEMHAMYSAQLAVYYNYAALMPENNNHGHTAIAWLVNNTRLTVLFGHIPTKLGWSSSTLGKALLYNNATAVVREQDCIIHDLTTLTQLQSVQKSDLRAPQGEHEDYADAFACAVSGAAAPVESETVDPGIRVNIGWEM